MAKELTITEKFINGLKFKNLSDNTIKTYEFCLIQLEREYPGQILEHLTKTELIYFLNKFNPSTRNTKLSCLRTFYAFCIEELIIKENPVEKLRNARTTEKMPEVLNLDEMAQLINLEKELIYKAIFAIFCHCGLRVDEVVNLNRDSIKERYDSKNKETYKALRVLGKGDKYREVPLSKNTLKWINYYLQTRTDDNLLPLFINNWGNRMSVASIQKRLKDTGDKMGKKLHPHLLRHSCATEYVRMGVPIPVVQKILGHSDIGTTQIYIHLAGVDTKNAIDQMGLRFSEEDGEDNE